MSETASQPVGKLDHHVEGHVGYVTFNNPSKFNAVNYDMWLALPQAMKALVDNPAVRLIVLQGAGDKAFVSGAPETKALSPAPCRTIRRTAGLSTKAFIAWGNASHMS